MRFYVALVFALLASIPLSVSAGCLDSLTSTETVYSKVRGFYINTGGSSEHYVILDKATCAATPTGDVALGTLKMSSDDKFLVSALLSAQATNAMVEFRLKPVAPAPTNNVPNEIAFVIMPAYARTQ